MPQFACFYLFLGSLFLIISPTFSQDTPNNVVFKKLGKKDGLINDTQNDFLYKDSYGYLWISSTQGVYKYDGSSFSHFIAGESKSQSMMDNNVQSDFFEDEYGNIWFATYTGFNKYDRSQDKITGFRVNYKNNEPINAGYHMFHIDTLRHDLWLAANDEIYRYDYNKASVKENIGTNLKSVRYFVETNKEGEVAKIYGTPWVLDAGVEILNKEDMKWKFQYKSLKNEVGSNNVSDILVLDDGAWLISNAGLIRLNADDEFEGTYFLDDSKGKRLYKGVVLGPDQILVSTERTGLYTFNLEGKNFTSFSALVDGEKIDFPCKLYIDDDNILWSGFNTGGIGRLDMNGATTSKPTIKVYEGNIRCFRFNGGLNLLSKENDLVLIDKADISKVKSKYKLPIAARDFEVDENGKLLFVDRNYLYSFDPNKKGFLTKLDRLDFDIMNISVLENEIYLTTFRGIYHWNRESKEFNRVEYKSSVNKDGVVYDIYAGKTEHLISNDSKDLQLIKLDGNTIEVLKSQAFNDFIYDAVQVNQTWYFVTVNGIFTVDKKSEIKKLELSSYIKEKGFNSIFPFGEQKLLVGNAEGLFIYNIENRSLLKINYLIANDLSITPKGLVGSPNENLVVLGKTGTYEVPLRELSIPIAKPELTLNYVEINNRIDKETEILQEELSEIELESNTQFFGLSLKLKDELLSGEGEIKYKDSRSSQWQTLLNGKLGLENLSPSVFDLSFLGIDNNLNASNIKTLRVVVKEPIYKRTPFIFASVLFLTMIAFLTGKVIERVNKDREKRQLKLQLAREQERNRIASMIHDDMGAILSTIQFASEDLSMDIEDKTMKQKAVAIQNEAKDLISRMRNNIWALQAEHKSIVALNKELRKSAFDQIGPLNLVLEYPLANEMPDKKLSGGVCMEIMLIQKESLNNIVKHAQAKSIYILNYCQDQKFILEIKDDGIGISGEFIPGMGLASMRKRAKAIKGELDIINSERGVTIKLTVPV